MAYSLIAIVGTAVSAGIGTTTIWEHSRKAVWVLSLSEESLLAGHRCSA